MRLKSSAAVQKGFFLINKFLLAKSMPVINWTLANVQEVKILIISTLSVK